MATNGGSGASKSPRPNPNRFRRGLNAGTGGTSFIPFIKDAPAGRSTVSMTDVVEISLGSEISVFLMDIFRCVGFRPKVDDERTLGLLPAPGKEGAMGVEDAETGGVGLPANGNARGFDIKAGDIEPKPGDGRGDKPCWSAGEYPGFGGG